MVFRQDESLVMILVHSARPKLADLSATGRRIVAWELPGRGQVPITCLDVGLDRPRCFVHAAGRPASRRAAHEEGHRTLLGLPQP